MDYRGSAASTVIFDLTTTRMLRAMKRQRQVRVQHRSNEGSQTKLP